MDPNPGFTSGKDPDSRLTARKIEYGPLAIGMDPDPEIASCTDPDPELTTGKDLP